MKTPEKTHTFPLLLAGALAAAGLVACEQGDAGDISETAQAVGAADSASATRPTPPRGPRSADKANRSGKRRGDGFGHRGPKDPSWLFERFDEDKDGKVALSDLPDMKQQWLASADANGDGFLTLDELKDHHEQRRTQFMKDVDTNGDGQISDAEDAAFRAKRHEERFSSDDTNGDGFLTESEVPEFRWQHLVAADANQDTKVSLDEIRTAIEHGTLKPPPHRGHGKGRRSGGRGGEPGCQGGPGGPAGPGGPPPTPDN